jgi:hypothetical protein
MVKRPFAVLALFLALALPAIAQDNYTNFAGSVFHWVQAFPTSTWNHAFEYRYDNGTQQTTFSIYPPLGFGGPGTQNDLTRTHWATDVHTVYGCDGVVRVSIGGPLGAFGYFNSSLLPFSLGLL